MKFLIQWCNDNQGVIAAIAILVVVIPSMFKFIPKCVKWVQQRNTKKKSDAHNANLKAVIRYLGDNTIANTKKLAQALDKSEEDIQKLLSELIKQGIVVAACDNCELSNPHSVWELRR